MFEYNPCRWQAEPGMIVTPIRRSDMVSATQYLRLRREVISSQTASIGASLLDLRSEMLGEASIDTPSNPGC